MGFRYRKSVKLGPFRLTASKRGMSLSAGVRGARITRRPGGGMQTTVGIPGSGLSYSNRTSTRRATAPTAKVTMQPSQPPGYGAVPPPPPWAPPTTPPGPMKAKRGAWYWVITAVSLGMLAAVPMWHAWSRLRTKGTLRLALGLTSSTFLGLALDGAAPSDATGSPTGILGGLGTAVIITQFVAGLAAVAVIRPRAYSVQATAPRTPIVAAEYADPAVAQALAARARREQARDLAARDPLLAKELKMGRPDLARTYDDGGLVELNTAPAEVIASVLSLDTATAAKIVEFRQRFSGFQTLEEVASCVSLTETQQAVLEDRGLVLRA